jgi:hypothetical protein
MRWNAHPWAKRQTPHPSSTRLQSFFSAIQSGAWPPSPQGEGFYGQQVYIALRLPLEGKLSPKATDEVERPPMGKETNTSSVQHQIAGHPFQQYNLVLGHLLLEEKAFKSGIEESI